MTAESIALARAGGSEAWRARYKCPQTETVPDQMVIQGLSRSLADSPARSDLD
ncbi:MAG: hypothetical protein LBV34_15065 [Nocardiopsaceae bacterium]|nr:hypothetical protein [Nocardiopsaceae bacterium]